MKRYTIVKEIGPLSLYLFEESGFVGPDQGFELESNEKDRFWLVRGEEKWESMTQAHAIDYWLERGDIAEKSESPEKSHPAGA